MSIEAIKLMACVSFPLTIITLISNIQMAGTVSDMNEILARQYDLNPQQFKERVKDFPYIKRTIHFKKVRFFINNDGDNAVVYFYDQTTHKNMVQESSCSLIRKHLQKSYVVRYDTRNGRYKINCDDGF